MEQKKEIEEIVYALEEIEQDSSTPKNVRAIIHQAKEILTASGDVSVNSSKAMNLLEELSENSNIEAFTRTQIWNMVSRLAKLS